MKVLLAAVNAKYIHSNPAVYDLKAYARKYSESVSIAEYTINQTTDEILADIYRRRPDILCFSCYLWNIACVEQLVTEINKILPETKIWLGGPEVSYDAAQTIKRMPAVSGIMYGEGEETFLELMEYFHTGHPSEEEIKGIVYRKEGTEVRENAPRPVIDLSLVPFPYQDIEAFRNRIIYYESSRGCPFSCSYCLSSVDKCLRFRKMELVKKELDFFLDKRVAQVKFVDRTFNCRHDHAMEIWKYIKEHDNGVTNFHFEVAADLINEQEIALIQSMRPGLIQLEIGVQSTNGHTVREIRRTMNLEKLAYNVNIIRESRNIHQHLDLIAGLPFEDYASFSNSFNTVYEMKPDQLQLGFLKVLKGSMMHEKAEEYGLLYQDRPPYEVLCTNWLGYGDIIRLKQIEEMTEVYYNSGQFKNTIEHLENEFAEPFEMYEALATYYDKNNLFKVSHSRIARYEILDKFISEKIVLDNKRRNEFKEWLTLDLYLRDNVRNRPEFLGKSSVSSDEAAAFYKQEEEKRIYLPEYACYDRRQMRKMTHLERIGGKLLLFDYRNRNPLNSDAAVIQVE